MPNTPDTPDKLPQKPAGFDQLPWLREGLEARMSNSHCPECGPARRVRVDLGDGKAVQMPVGCEHIQARQEAAAEALKAREALTEYHKRFGNYRVPEAYADLTLLSIDPRRIGSKKGQAYVDYYLTRHEQLISEGAGLVFHGVEKSSFKNPGSPGTGKTLCATVLALELERRGVAVAYFKLRDLLGQLKNFDIKDNVTAAMRAARVLVLDELVNEHETPYTTQEIIGALDARYEAGKPTIITTNFERPVIGAHYEHVLTRQGGAVSDHAATVMVRRFLSRMQAPRFMWVPFDGPDQRLAQSQGASWGPQFD